MFLVSLKLGFTPCHICLIMMLYGLLDLCDWFLFWFEERGKIKIKELHTDLVLFQYELGIVMLSPFTTSVQLGTEEIINMI